MDLTQSSENESLKADMSYLYGRDPSILAYGQRPFPSQESKKNLISLLEEEKEDDDSIGHRDRTSTSTTDSMPSQTIKVFLRMKPFPRKIKLSPEQEDAYSILNSTTLLTKMPSLDNNTSCLKKIKTCETVCRKFIFTQTFGSETSQLHLFEKAVKPQMFDFLTGKSAVVMSYGTTNSGKTYTLQGIPESPGIIPRGIEFVFSNITPRTMPCYKPTNLCDIVHLSNQERLQEVDFKMKLLSFNPVDKSSHLSVYKQMQQLLHQESPMKLSHNYDAHYSVWVSFAEIYNETIYDLLWNDCQKKRPSLKLGVDSRGRAFIKGLRSICVNSGAEAYQVLMAGQYNLKVAATALNSRSSRSHCIFTIKLLKYRNEHDPHSVAISTFTFCDLAGSERLKKTLNVGERLKEAQNINTSLLVLGRCLKTIYESQNCTKSRNESIGPFRESKLTRLFQRALSGKEQIALIVNVNPLPNLYVETQNVLNFSAIAKKIIIKRTDIVKRRQSHSRFSRLVTQSMKTDMDWENTELDDMTEASEDCIEQDFDVEENDEEAYEDLLLENELLKKEVKELKDSILQRDMQTRQEMTEMYSSMLKKLEEDWKNRLIDMEEQQEDLRELAVERIELFYKEKINQLNFRKRSRPSEVDEDDDIDSRLEDLEVENTRLIAKIETMKKTIRDLKSSKENIESEKTKISFELTVSKEEIKRINEMLSAAKKSIEESSDDVSTSFIKELEEIVKTKDDRIKKMKTFLNEAKEEYIYITDQAQKFENQIKLQEEHLAENVEHIKDLEEQLSQANAYSAEQSKIIESLEEELDQQIKKQIEAEEKIKSLSEEITKLCSSKSDENSKVIVAENVISKEEYEKTKASLEEMILKFKSSNQENIHLKDELNQKLNDIQSLENNLCLTKDQLDKISDKVKSLSINDSEDNVKQKSPNNTEQGIPSVCGNATTHKSTECTPDVANISCQTVEINTAIETEEKSLQTSFCLNQSLNQSVKKEMTDVEDLKLEVLANETMNELQIQHDELKQILEKCKFEKEEAQRQFEQTVKELHNQMTELKAELQEKEIRISTLQKDMETIVQTYEEEKRNFQAVMETEDVRNKDLMNQIAKVVEREQDKDKEICSLQKEMKNLIQSNEESSKKWEVEMKSALKDLAAKSDDLTREQEKSKRLDKEYKQVINILEMRLENLEQRSLEKQTETEKLKFKIDELKMHLESAQHELEVFTRNRDETVAKYENLVKSQYDDIERLQKETTRLQEILQEVKENTSYVTPFKSSSKKTRSNLKEEKKKTKTSDKDNTSEEDHFEENRTEKSKPKKQFLSPTKDNIPVIELSGSESKRSAKSSTKEKEPPKSTRRTRRKKLFTQLNESYVDIEPSEPSPSTSTRNLRARRDKKIENK